MLPPLSPEQLKKPRWFEPRVGLLYAAVFVPNGVHLPYFPLWLEHTGFTPEEIAVILSAPLFMRVLAGPLVSALADRAPDRVPVMIAFAVLAALAACGYFLPPTYGLVLAVSLAFAVAYAPHTPVADSIAQSGVRRFGSDYAKMRIWGSVSFLLTNIVCGWILARTGAGAIPPLLVLALGTVVAAALAAPWLGRPRRRMPLPTEALPQAASVLVRPYFLIFVTAASITQSSHALMYTFGSIYWKSIGISETAVGFLWAFSVVAEVAMFVAFRRTFGRLRSPVVLALGSGIAVLRWVAYPLVELAGLGLGAFFAIQALHAFSFSLVFLAMQKMIGESVPEERMGAAQGIAFFLTGGLLAALTLLSGPLYHAYGVGGFHAMAAVSALAMLLGLVAIRLEKA